MQYLHIFTHKADTEDADKITIYYVILLLTHAERNRSSLSSIVNVYFIYLPTNKVLPKDEFYMLALRI